EGRASSRRGYPESPCGLRPSAEGTHRFVVRPSSRRGYVSSVACTDTDHEFANAHRAAGGRSERRRLDAVALAQPVEQLEQRLVGAEARLPTELFPSPSFLEE